MECAIYILENITHLVISRVVNKGVFKDQPSRCVCDYKNRLMSMGIHYSTLLYKLCLYVCLCACMYVVIQIAVHIQSYERYISLR